MPDVFLRGLTLAQLRRLSTDVRVWFKQGGFPGRKSWDQVLLGDVAEYYIKPINSANECSYMETVAPCAQQPAIYLDEICIGSFSDLMDCIEWFAEAQQLNDSVVFWGILWIHRLDVPFSTIYGPESFNGQRHELTWDQNVVKAVHHCTTLLAMCDASTELTVRSNKMKTMQTFFEEAKHVFLGSRSGVLACTVPFDGLRGSMSWEFGHFDTAIARVILVADWGTALCGDKDVEARYKAEMERKPRGLVGFGNRLARVATGPLLREAAFSGDTSLIRDICTRPGFVINSPALQDSLGATAAHCAAAAGHVGALQALLDCSADPNAEDHIRETPMHHAALAAELEAVTVLLRYGGLATIESLYLETPLDVAVQNPAAFLGRDTKPIVALLQAWITATGDGATTHRATEPHEKAAQATNLKSHLTVDGQGCVAGVKGGALPVSEAGGQDLAMDTNVQQESCLTEAQISRTFVERVAGICSLLLIGIVSRSMLRNK